MLDPIIDFAHRWGDDPFLIQGPGGNLSQKDSGRLWIKGSGFDWKSISKTKGMVEVNVESFLSAAEKAACEKDYADAVGAARVDLMDARPSMELGFHALLPQKYVIHVHSLVGILLDWSFSSSLGAGIQDWLAEQGVRCVQIPVCMPGLELMKEFQQRLSEFSAEPIVLAFMESHGLVWAGNDLTQIERIADSFEKKLRELFRTERFPLPISHNNGDYDFSSWENFNWPTQALFPDFALCLARATFTQVGNLVSVKGNSGFSGKALCELIFAQALLGQIGKELGQLKVVPRRISGAIANIETEKLRLVQSGNEGKI